MLYHYKILNINKDNSLFNILSYLQKIGSNSIDRLGTVEFLINKDNSEIIDEVNLRKNLERLRNFLRSTKAILHDNHSDLQMSFANDS